MLATSTLSLLSLALLSFASPLPSSDITVREVPGTLRKRFTNMCDQWGTESENSGHFLLYNNRAVSMSAWKTTYKFTGGAGHVKSYPKKRRNFEIKRIELLHSS
ncbi:hypothetical protein BDY24DRAFT_413746 [Mrakia frigida]|uniref:uncharacterized protein n=1 Tax=Mrakia frigida TaxID=29902 RepID=UPI003FCBFB18